MSEADKNIRVFIGDLGMNVRVKCLGQTAGKFVYQLQHEDRVVQVVMPDTDLARVRFTGDDHQRIWDFPHLLVDGAAWVWRYALEETRRALEE